MKKGFTLIELLAVIVILAIIALIATPIVLSIINDSKESAILRSAEFYVDAVQNKIMQENMKLGGKLNPEECIVNNEGNVTCDGVDLEIEVDGEKTTSGSIKFDNGKIIDVTLTFGQNNTVSMNDKGEFVLGEAEASMCTLINGNENEIGSKYQCKVKDNMETGFEDGYYFYVLSYNNDGTTNLIMDRNIYYDETNDIGIVATEPNKGLVAWYTSMSNIYGPVTAMNYLHNATKDWNNIPNMIMDYEDENIDYGTGEKGTTGYGSIKTTGTTTVITRKNGEETGKFDRLKARMPKYDEVHGTGKCLNNQYGSCPLWLSNYLNSNSNVTEEGLQNISGISGYLTLSSSDFQDADPSDIDSYLVAGKAWTVSDDGFIDDPLVDISSRYGVRPVITLEL